ncbi:amidohydrolase family protein [Streptomyces jumonjinensis]|uniref:Amidohydrolase n=1 Tax=Streptomyces jumonjinensis TaxID=1945 RepID=A0A646KTS1_STRJU|nr:amidohydrolase family protein [Streptomyces jumonjinensis]MQT05271.1 amidohydrolase [Streptomyces jumonjinensis]
MDTDRSSAPVPRPFPFPFSLSRRELLAAAGVAGAATALGPAPAAARTSAGTSLILRRATNGSATLSPAGDRLIAEVQSVLWSLPGSGGRAVPLTPADLEPGRPAHSPDGALIAFSAYRDGGFHLWTMRPDGTELRQRTEGPWDDRGPAWSPDGTRIAFASERAGDPVTGGPYRIHVLELRTGALTRITGTAGQDGPVQDGPWEDFDPVWSPDGERILFVRAHAVTTPTGPALAARTIAAVPARGAGPVTTVHTGPADAQLMTPALARDGRLAHLRTTPAPNGSCVLVVDGAPVAVDGDLAAVPPRWTAGGELLLTVDGRFTLVRPDRPGQPRRIPFEGVLPVTRPRYRVKEYDIGGARVRPVRGIHLPALSPDGKSIAFAALNTLWLADASGARPPRSLRRSSPVRYLLGPVWARDGRSLLYADDRDGLLGVYRRDLATGEERALATGGRVHPALSPDGERLACLDMTGGLRVRDLTTGAERVLAAPLGGGGLPGRPSWSPDGRFIALCDRNRLNLRFREGYNLIRIVDSRTGDDRLHAVAPHGSVSDRYDSGPVWSPDGRQLAVIVESALCLLPVAPDGSPRGALRTLTEEPADHPSWSGDSRTLLYLSGARLRLIDAAGGPARTVRVPLDARRPTPADTVIHAGRLWDGTGDSVRDDADIVVRDGRIAAVEPHRAHRTAALRRIDASRRTVVPGLWDTHTHPWQSTYGARQSVGQLTYGITTAVSLGGFAYEQARIREAVTSGQLAGPRLLTTGELLDGSRVAYSMGRAHRTRAGLRRSLERGAALDWDSVKTYVRAPGWIMAEAARFAHERLGVRAGSHLLSPGIQLGQDLTTHLQATQRAETGHAVTASGRAYDDLLEIYSARGAEFGLIATPFTAAALAGLDPGLADDPRVTRVMPPWDIAVVRQQTSRPPSPAQLETLRVETDVYRRVLDRGGLVALGTDAPLTPVGLALHLGLRALHRAGLSPAAALRTVTVLPARLFGAERDLGTVEPGKAADLTVVDGDPFDDFDTMVRTVSVLRGGVPYTTGELVAAMEPPPERAPRGEDDWLRVGRLMLGGGCCDARD